MGLNTGETAVEGDFIKEAERDGTPANDENRVPQFEADGRLSPFFTRNGAVLNCGETINGTTVPVPVYQDKTDNELYACDANDLNKLKFIGFVTTNGTNGNPARFQGIGVVSGFTGLAEGEKYYLQDTAGTIGPTPGTYEVLVGIAISETQLLIMRSRRFAANAVTTGTATGSSVITCGFRPSVIRLKMASAGGPTVPEAVSFGNWINGVMTGGGYSENNSSPIVYANGAFIVRQSSVDFFTITITSVTDTGFTLNWTETGNMADSVIVWEAEGEL